MPASAKTEAANKADDCAACLHLFVQLHSLKQPDKMFSHHNGHHNL